MIGSRQCPLFSRPLFVGKLNLGLPDGSGLDLMRQLVASGKAIKAIALSGYGTEDDARKSREAGFAEHLIKPVNLAELVATIEGVVGQQVAVVPLPM